MDFAGFMAAYSQFFGTKEQPNLPARSTVQVAGLVAPGMLVEIEVQLVEVSAAVRASGRASTVPALAFCRFAVQNAERDLSVVVRAIDAERRERRILRHRAVVAVAELDLAVGVVALVRILVEHVGRAHA